MAAAAAGFSAGAINSIAGGGTLISFPALVWLGLPSITANATNTVAIWPGSLGSIWGFRKELGQTEPRLRWLAVASLVGGGAGAVLLRLTPPGVFDRLVPFLILFATLLFTFRSAVQQRLRRASPGHTMRLLPALVFQFFVAVYGGYFGAGMSIMALAALGVIGMTDILQMNALTSLFALCINGVASLFFISAHMVDWRYIVPMAIAAIIGGYGAAGAARRIGRTAVARLVTVVGFAMAIALFFKRW